MTNEASVSHNFIRSFRYLVGYIRDIYLCYLLPYTKNAGILAIYLFIGSFFYHYYLLYITPKKKFIILDDYRIFHKIKINSFTAI